MIYAPIRRVSDVTTKNGRLAGHALSDAGEPGAIELVSGPHVIGVVRADRKAGSKANAGRRQDGCGFGIDLRPADFIFSDELVLRCAVSKEVLHVVPFGSVEWPAQPRQTRQMSVADILARDGKRAPGRGAASGAPEEDGRAAEQLIEKWSELMFPGMEPNAFRAFLDALKPGSPERAALLALADLGAPTVPRPAKPGLPEDKKHAKGKAVGGPVVEDGIGSNS